MADRNIPLSDKPSSSGSENVSGGGATMPEENGHHPAGVNRLAAAQSDAARQAEQRAEEMVDHAAERVAEFTATLKHKLAQVVARAREEVEDIWAEAQSLRRGEK